MKVVDIDLNPMTEIERKDEDTGPSPMTEIERKDTAIDLTQGEYLGIGQSQGLHLLMSLGPDLALKGKLLISIQNFLVASGHYLFF